MKKGFVTDDSQYVRQGFGTYQKTANTLQKRIQEDEEAMRWLVEHEDEIRRVYDSSYEYNVNEALPVFEDTDKRYEILKDNQVEQMRTYGSIYERLMIDLYWWNLFEYPSVIKIKLPNVLLKLISCRYLEDGKRSCKKVAKLSGYKLGTVYNFFSELRKLIKQELKAL